MKHFEPHEYQKECFRFLIDRLYHSDDQVKGGGLLLDPGLGKTAITMWVLEALRDLGVLNRALIVAPKRVCDTTWREEPEKWGSDLSFTHISGTPRQRLAQMQECTDVHVINPENVKWLVEQKGSGYCTVVADESTKFKNWSAKRTRAMKKLVNGAPRRIILTGTPAPNGYADMFSQIYLLDDGKSLGKTISYFRSNFMRKGGFQGREWEFRSNNKEQFEAAIAPLVLRMSALEHLDMPDYVDKRVTVNLPADIMKEYKRLEKDLFMELDKEKVLAKTAGAKYTMCRGVANGGIYLKDEMNQNVATHVHDTKVNALEELVEELGGKSVMVAYPFNHDLERLQKRWPDAPVIKGGTKNTQEIVEAWNRREIPILFVQPQALSHGVNMQAGGCDVVWFGLTDQLEVYQQFNARVYRQGQENGMVRIQHLICADTIDEMMYYRVHRKADDQTSLMNELQRYRNGKQD